MVEVRLSCTLIFGLGCEMRGGVRVMRFDHA